MAIVIGVALLLAGCGKHYWNKPGAGPAEFTQDNRECAQRNAVSMSADKTYGIVVGDPYRACLRARGWTRDQKPDPVPAGWFRGFESDEMSRLDVPPPQPQQQEGVTPRSDLPICPRGIAPVRDLSGRVNCRTN